MPVRVPSRDRLRVRCRAAREGRFLASGGGFDERFAPMYYEDADLCFEARERGLRVMYEPGPRSCISRGPRQARTSRPDQALPRVQPTQIRSKWRDRLEREHLLRRRGEVRRGARRHEVGHGPDRRSPRAEMGLRCRRGTDDGDDQGSASARVPGHVLSGQRRRNESLHGRAAAHGRSRVVRGSRRGWRVG